MKILVKDPSIKINKTMKPYTAKDFFTHSIIILDKPSGPRCREVTEKLKQLSEISHAGHAGTLDPKVTGVLPIGVEKATKVLGLLSVYPKTYEGEMKVHGEVKRKDLESGVKKFTGKIKQLPPKISAVKRAMRVREVYSFDILSYEDRILKYKIVCEAGTYIRKICHDLGEYLGVGGHMTQLRRTQSGPFTLKDTVTVEKFEKEYKKYLKTKEVKHLKSIMKPVEVITKDMPKVWVDDKAVDTMLLGAPLFAPGVLQLTDGIKKDDFVALLTTSNRMIALGKARMTSKEIMKAKKGICIKTDSVLIPVKH